MQKDVSGDFIPGTTRIKYGGAYIDQKEIKAIKSVLDRNWWTIDEECQKLEQEIAEFSHCKRAVVVNSGSSALLLAFNALDLPEGSEVITSAVHFPTSISALYYNKLTPVYVDVEMQTLGIDPLLIEQAITDKTKAILVVAIAGSIPHLKLIREIANKHGLIVVLDNCDGFGGTIHGEPIETYADVSCTSFHAAHILAMGEGGAVITNNENLADHVKSLREWGRVGDTDDTSKFTDMPSDYPGRYIFQYIGFNLKPLELQCAMGREQLKKVNNIKTKRQKAWTFLDKNLNDVPRVHLLPIEYSEASWFAYPMFVADRPALRKFLEDRQIETRTIFGGNITKQPAFKNFGRIASDLTWSDHVMTDGMFVSVHPSLTFDMLRYVVESIKEFYA